MASIVQSFRNRAYLQNSLALLLFFGSWGIWWSFFPIWLANDIGLNGEQTGEVYAVNSFASLVIMFLYGPLQDRLGTKRYVAIFASVIMTLTAPFFILVYKPLLQSSFVVGMVVGAVFLSAGFMSAVGLFESLAERFSRIYGYEYGQARMWGSFGYAVVALAAGFLFNVSPNVNFSVASVIGAVSLALLVFWPLPKRPVSGTSGGQEQSTPGLKEIAGVLRLRAFWVIVVFVLCTWTFYTAFDQQMFPKYYIGLFNSEATGNSVYGVLNSIQVFMEAVCMGLVPILMRRVGVKTTLMMGVTVMCLRIGLCGVFHDPIGVSIVKMFHALEVPLFVLGIFRYITLHFKTAMSATLYLVGFQIAAQIGNVILSPPLGHLRDQLGFRTVFFIISGLVAVGGVFGYFALKKDDVDVLGDPLVAPVAAEVEASN